MYYPNIAFRSMKVLKSIMAIALSMQSNANRIMKQAVNIKIVGTLYFTMVVCIQ